MILNLLKFELKYRIGRPGTWAYFGILFLFGFLNAIYGSSPASEKVLANSPAAITYMLIVISIFGTLLASAVMGVPVYRDLEHKTHHYYYTYPISEKQYLLGRYFGSLIILLLISLGMHIGLIIGFALGPHLGLEEAERFGPLILSHYLHPTFTVYWTNFLFTGSLFFALVALTRKVFVTYTGSVLLFIAYLLGLTFASDLDNKDIVSLLDPFAFSTFENESAYWTPYEQNTQLFKFTGLLVWNRIIYLSIAALVFLFTLWRFKFSDSFLVKSKKKEETKVVSTEKLSLIKVPRFQTSFSFLNYFRQMLRLARLEFKNIVRDVYFLAMMLGAVIFLFLDGWFGQSTYGTPALPMTYYMLEVKDFNYGIFVFIIIIFYTGEAVHRDKSIGFSNIANALPVPSWMIYGSKFVALFLVCLVLATMVIVSGVANQVLQGFTDFQMGMYIKDVYLLEFPDYLQLTMLAFVVHILVNSKFLGHVINIAIWILLLGIREFAEYDYNMAFYSYRPSYTLSDMNGFGHFWPGQNWFNLYWTSLGIFFLIAGNLFWNRSSETNFKTRIALLRQRLNVFPITGIVLTLLSFVVSGYVIFNNTSRINRYYTSDEQTERQANYEKKYAAYADFRQPKVSAVEVDIDVYPDERRAEASGLFSIFNQHDRPIDTLMLSMGVDYSKIEDVSSEEMDIELSRSDEAYNVYFYTLDPPLEPGDTTVARMSVDVQFKGFPNSGSQREIVYNGTFFNLNVFPSFGYNEGQELTSDQDRKKYKLPEKDYNLPSQNDSTGLRNLLFSDDANYVAFRGTVSTSKDQVAIMPGYLEKEWIDGERKYFTYVMDVPIQLFFNISSAAYEVTEDLWQGEEGEEVKIQIFHHPSHAYNLDRLILSTKHSLDYFSKNFGPYQHRQMRILEFPRYASFAQSFPNTVPYSENFGWVADFSDPNDIDYAYTVTAHEVAHQWWGHTVAPSATRGANQISESMAEYSSLMVMKKQYGPEAMQKFLKYELDRYLRGRANESKFEKTLLDNDTQSYVWYRKGGLILYALADYLSEERLNEGFRALVDTFGLKSEPPYVTTWDWYEFMKGVTPDSLQYYLEDSFENIVLYENKVNGSTYEILEDSTYRVTIDLTYDKIYYDGLGEELKRGEEKNLIEVGIFEDDTENDLGMTQKSPILLKKEWLVPGSTTLTYVVDKKPSKAGIDPYNKLIDRIPDDNLKNIEESD